MQGRHSIAKLLRAPWNFEFDYDGHPGNVPVIFTAPYTATRPAIGIPDPQTAVDAEALQAVPPLGVSPVLAKMIPVPMGATVAVYFPIVQRPGVLVEEPPIVYAWRTVFRMRTVADYLRRKKHRVAWSIPLTRFGSADTRTGHPPNRVVSITGPRVVRPASGETIVYNRTEPNIAQSAPFLSRIANDTVMIPRTDHEITMSPIYPGSYLDADPATIRTLDYEQGERDPGQTPHVELGFYQQGPFHLCKFLKCLGDEMAVECYKYAYIADGTYQPRDWSFLDGAGDLDNTAEDFQFSLLLGMGATALAVPGIPPVDTGVRFLIGSFPQ